VKSVVKIFAVFAFCRGNYDYLKTPKGFHNKAQGCAAPRSRGATLGSLPAKKPTLKGLPSLSAPFPASRAISSVCLLCVFRVSAVRLHFPSINFFHASLPISVKSVVKIFAVFAFCRGNFQFLVAAPLLCGFALKIL